MSTLLLLRHGLTAMTGPVLAGRTPGVHLDERGHAQAAAAAARIAALPLAAVVTSPLERCTDTAAVVRAAQQAAGREPAWEVDDRLVECGYGDWTGRALKDLAKDPMWKVVQTQPSAARFPAGEAMIEMSARAVAAVRDWDARLGPDAIWVACSHADVIKDDPRRRPRSAPRPVPAHRRRPLLGVGRPLHRDTPLRAAGQRRRRRTVRLRAAGQEGQASQGIRCDGRRRRRQRPGLSSPAGS